MKLDSNNCTLWAGHYYCAFNCFWAATAGMGVGGEKIAPAVTVRHSGAAGGRALFGTVGVHTPIFSPRL
jgi:hypothetical protein